MKRLAILAATLAFALAMSIDAAMADPNGGGGGGVRPEAAPFQMADPNGNGGGRARPEPAPFQTACNEEPVVTGA